MTSKKSRFEKPYAFLGRIMKKNKPARHGMVIGLPIKICFIKQQQFDIIDSYFKEMEKIR